MLELCFVIIKREDISKFLSFLRKYWKKAKEVEFVRIFSHRSRQKKKPACHIPSPRTSTTCLKHSFSSKSKQTLEMLTPWDLFPPADRWLSCFDLFSSACKTQEVRNVSRFVHRFLHRFLHYKWQSQFNDLLNFTGSSSSEPWLDCIRRSPSIPQAGCELL